MRGPMQNQAAKPARGRATDQPEAPITRANQQKGTTSSATKDWAKEKSLTWANLETHITMKKLSNNNTRAYAEA